MKRFPDGLNSKAAQAFPRMTLESLGWSDFFEQAWRERYADETGCIPGRIASSLRGAYIVWTADGEIEAKARGKLVRSPATRPVTGDWVALCGSPSTVQAVLPRRTKVSRKAPGEKTVEQLLAANLDVLFIVTGLDRDFNLRRLERYLAVAWEGGAQPVVVLNKADVCDEADERVAETRRIAGEAPVVLTSAETGVGLDELRRFLAPGKTAALIGSSGVGKSALTNRLFGAELRAVGALRESDGRGRHTTVGREIVRAPDGWLLMDLPGIREVEPWSDEGFEQTFEDVEQLIAACRFRDCSHGSEPGCAVREALQAGELDADRWQSYQRLQQGLRQLDVRQKELKQTEQRRNVRAFRRTPKR